MTPEGVIGVELSAIQPSMATISRASPLAVNFYPAQEWYHGAKALSLSVLGKAVQEIPEGAAADEESVFYALLRKAAQERR